MMKMEQRILETAIVSIAERGSPDIAMGDLARAAGISRSTLYRHFPTRQALLEGLFDAALEGFQNRLSLAIAARPAVGDRIDAVADFLAAELAAGLGRHLYLEDVELMLRLTSARIDMLIDHFQAQMAPLFDAADILGARPIERTAVAEVFVRFYPSLVLMPRSAETPPPRDLFAWLLRSLINGR